MEVPSPEIIAKAMGTVFSAFLVAKFVMNRKPTNQKKRFLGGDKPVHAQDPSKAKMDDVFNTLQANFDKNVTSEISATGRWDYYYRIQQLYGLRDMIVENQEAIWEAAKKDVGRTKGEMVLEVGADLAEIDSLINGLKNWMKPEARGTPLWMQPASSYIIREPLGVCLVVGTWNYVSVTCILPLAGAICGGNAVIVKPSEHAPAQGALYAKLLPKYVDPAMVQVFEGGPKISQTLVDSYSWGKVFYTGGGKIGAMIGASCASRLVPFCLELGGKSPTVILEDAELVVTCRRVIQGKFVNEGQTCIAPDFVIAVGDEKRQKQVAEALVAEIKKQYPGDISKSADYARIVNNNHFKRVTALMQGAGKIIHGGKCIEEDRFIEPTVFVNVPENAAIMQEEIFGPLLPIVNLPTVNEAVDFIRRRPKPLCIYIFGSNGREIKHLISRTTSGTACVNEAVFQYLNPHLPFGGIGASGTGAHHGQSSFIEFSHSKSVMVRSLFVDIYIRYLPYLAEDWVQKVFTFLLAL